MQIRISDSSSDVAELASFFERNVTSSYISHSELQSDRALAEGLWAPNLKKIIEKEVADRLGPTLAAFPVGSGWNGVIEVREDGTLIGLALVSANREVPVPFGTIEDVIVDEAQRGQGVGQILMEWIIENFRASGIKRLFLESGEGNERAHHLFDTLGFRKVSIVMSKDL